MSAEPRGVTPEMTPARRIDHVAVATRDAGSAADWYVQHLGLRRVHDERVEEAGTRLVWLEPDGESLPGTARFQIVEPLRPGPVATYIEEHGEGLHHVCFVVDEAGAFLEQRGEEAQQVFRGGFGLPCAFLKRTPPGVNIEIVQKGLDA